MQTATPTYDVQMVPAAQIVAGNNDRKTFDKQALRELAANIEANGLIQPPTVRERPDGTFEIVAGERRTRAMRLLEWPEIPCLVKTLSDQKAAAIMLTENVSRVDLNPIEEANAYQTRMEEFGWSAEEVARAAGVTPQRVRLALPLLSLTPEVQHLVKMGEIKRGYAQTLALNELDANFQMVATRALANNPAPTPTWFHRLCGELKEKQGTAYLFDELPIGGGTQPLFDVQQFMPELPDEEPPLPETHTAPDALGSIAGVIRAHMAFWQEAAAVQEQLCRNLHVRECQAAAKALEDVLANIGRLPESLF